jgi:hypothetical protein
MRRAMRRWLVPWAALASLAAPLALSGCPVPWFEDCDCLWDPPPGTLPPPPADPPPPDEPPGTPPSEPTEPVGGSEPTTTPGLRRDPTPDAAKRPRIDPDLRHGPSETPSYPR